VTALDSSPEMIELSRKKIDNDPECVISKQRTDTGLYGGAVDAYHHDRTDRQTSALNW